MAMKELGLKPFFLLLVGLVATALADSDRKPILPGTTTPAPRDQVLWDESLHPSKELKRYVAESVNQGCIESINSWFYDDEGADRGHESYCSWFTDYAMHVATLAKGCESWEARMIKITACNTEPNAKRREEFLDWEIRWPTNEELKSTVANLPRRSQAYFMNCRDHYLLHQHDREAQSYCQWIRVSGRACLSNELKLSYDNFRHLKKTACAMKSDSQQSGSVIEPEKAASKDEKQDGSRLEDKSKNSNGGSGIVATLCGTLLITVLSMSL